MRIPLAIAALAFTIGPLSAQWLEARVYDLSRFVRAPDSMASVDETEPFLCPTPNPLPTGYDDHRHPGGVVRVNCALGRPGRAEPLVRWLVRALETDDAVNAVRVGEVIESGRVLIEADAETHARLARRIAGLEAAALRPIEVALIRLPGDALDDVPPNGLLKGEALADLLAHRTPTAMWRRSSRTGVPIVLLAGEVRSYMRDADVEVASEAEIFDPKMDVLHLGLMGTLQVARAPGGGAFVTCAIRRTHAPRTTPTRKTEQARVEIPAVDVELHEVRSYLETDGAIVLGATAAGGSTWIVQIRGLGAGRPDAVQLGGVEAVPWRDQPAARIGALPLRPPGYEEIAVDREPSPLLPTDVGEAMSRHDANEDVPGLHLGDSWVAAKESAALTHVLALARAHAEGHAIAIRYAVATLDAPDAVRVLAPDADLALTAARAELRGVLPTRTGDLARAFLGTERAFLRDHEVEIAQAAAVANPIFDTWMDGTWITLRANAADNDSYRLLGSVGVQRAADGPQQLERWAYDHGPIDAPRIEHARIELDRTLQPGAWRLAELTPIGQHGAHVAVLVRIDR